MSRILQFAFLLLFLGGVQAQQTCENRYQSKVFNSVQVFRDVVYSKAAPKLIAASLGIETTINHDLVMDIFMPPPTDPAVKRPLVIIAHGGGFVDVAFMGGTLLVGTKDNEDVQALCDTLAHWGYVTACIEYRTGFDVLSNTSLKRAVWRGAQDMSAAIRFFRKNATWFNIDPARVFIGGSSAGAFCAIHSTFIDSQERIPESLQQTPLVMLDLGELHSRPVVELTGFNPFAGNNVQANDVDSIAQGVVGFWGAIADTDMFQGTNKAPMIMFHGTNDPIVDSRCAQPFSSLILVAPVTCGSEIMDSVMTLLNMPHSTTIEPGKGHEYWGALNGAWVSNGPNAYWKPLIQSTADYFYAIMQPQAPIVNGPAAVAPNVSHNYAVASPNPTSTYCWEITGGTIVSPVTDGPNVDVLFYTNTTLGAVKCSEIDAAEVASEQRIRLVNVSSLLAQSSIETASSLSFSLVPNPANDFLTLVLPENTPTEMLRLEIFDILGRSMKLQRLQTGNYTLDVSHLEAGNYWVRLSNGQQQSTARLSIVK